jgi:hypothetical protein
MGLNLTLMPHNQDRKILFDGLPDSFKINSKRNVNQHIPHPDDVFPGNGGKLLGGFIIQLAGRVSNDFRVPLNGPLQQTVIKKVVFRSTISELGYFAGGVEDMLEAFSISLIGHILSWTRPGSLHDRPNQRTSEVE